MLKSKGRDGLLLVLCLISSFFANAQKDLVISGGNTVSSFVCANKTAFVWGSNAGGQLGLHDASGA
ncbi:MAG TPA: hypothetical protein VK796_12640, partial [Cytophaga sp.]|nr:hypothetical protein [Cytophaga sp.]